mmetsp:Transcript_28940/g.56338  ORF Transcript_28940/g.56338 Transcript_28940/m.56338 type:complete len:215 (-) Transcript_28940:591-1235(-)
MSHCRRLDESVDAMRMQLETDVPGAASPRRTKSRQSLRISIFARAPGVGLLQLVQVWREDWGGLVVRGAFRPRKNRNPSQNQNHHGPPFRAFCAELQSQGRFSSGLLCCNRFAWYACTLGLVRNPSHDSRLNLSLEQAHAAEVTDSSVSREEMAPETCLFFYDQLASLDFLRSSVYWKSYRRDPFRRKSPSAAADASSRPPAVSEDSVALFWPP